MVSLPVPIPGEKPSDLPLAIPGKSWDLGNLCLSPLLGLVLYLVWKDSQRAKAQEACRLTWWAVGIWGVLFVLMVLATIVAEA